jgi:hypothetical protein
MTTIASTRCGRWVARCSSVIPPPSAQLPSRGTLSRCQAGRPRRAQTAETSNYHPCPSRPRGRACPARSAWTRRERSGKCISNRLRFPQIHGPIGAARPQGRRKCHSAIGSRLAQYASRSSVFSSGVALTFVDLDTSRSRVTSRAYTQDRCRTPSLLSGARKPWPGSKSRSSEIEKAGTKPVPFQLNGPMHDSRQKPQDRYILSRNA